MHKPRLPANQTRYSQVFPGSVTHLTQPSVQLCRVRVRDKKKIEHKLPGLARVDQQVVLLTGVHEEFAGMQRVTFIVTCGCYTKGALGGRARGPGRCAATEGRPVLAAGAKPAGTTATPACSPSRSASLLSWRRGGRAKPGASVASQQINMMSPLLKIQSMNIRSLFKHQNSFELLGQFCWKFVPYGLSAAWLS